MSSFKSELGGGLGKGLGAGVVVLTIAGIGYMIYAAKQKNDEEKKEEDTGVPSSDPNADQIGVLTTTTLKTEDSNQTVTTAVTISTDYTDKIATLEAKLADQINYLDTTNAQKEQLLREINQIQNDSEYIRVQKELADNIGARDQARSNRDAIVPELAAIQVAKTNKEQELAQNQILFGRVNNFWDNLVPFGEHYKYEALVEQNTQELSLLNLAYSSKLADYNYWDAYYSDRCAVVMGLQEQELYYRTEINSRINTVTTIDVTLGTIQPFIDDLRNQIAITQEQARGRVL